MLICSFVIYTFVESPLLLLVAAPLVAVLKSVLLTAIQAVEPSRLMERRLGPVLLFLCNGCQLAFVKLLKLPVSFSQILPR